MPQLAVRSAPEPGPTLAKAVLRAAALLEVNQTTLAAILGVSKATASRLAAGGYRLDPGRAKEWELAVLFVRLFRSLDALLGHGEKARVWLRSPNVALGAPPLDLMKTAEGLVRVVHYLDHVRGRI